MVGGPIQHQIQITAISEVCKCSKWYIVFVYSPQL